MAFADPQSLTVGSSTITLPRVNSGSNTGTFKSGDDQYSLEISPLSLKSGRRSKTVRIRNTKVTADPLISTTNVVVSDSIRLVIDTPSQGYSEADVLAQLAGLITWLTASSNANAKKLIGGEN